MGVGVAEVGVGFVVDFVVDVVDVVDVVNVVDVVDVVDLVVDFVVDAEDLGGVSVVLGLIAVEDDRASEEGTDDDWCSLVAVGI